MKRKIPLLSLVITLLLILTWQQFQMKSLLQTNLVLTEKLSLYKEQIDVIDRKFNLVNEENKKSNEANAAAYSDAITFYQEALSQLNDALKEQVDIISKGVLKEDLLVFQLLNENGTPYIDHYGILDSGLEDEQKLAYVAHYLVEHYFSDASIKVESIQMINGKRTAVINLSETYKEGEVGHKSGWSTRYFQGSTGGSMTEFILIEGFLQRYNKDWPVDSVKFLYEHRTLAFDHVPKLSSVQNRN